MLNFKDVKLSKNKYNNTNDNVNDDNYDDDVYCKGKVYYTVSHNSSSSKSSKNNNTTSSIVLDGVIFTGTSTIKVPCLTDLCGTLVIKRYTGRTFGEDILEACGKINLEDMFRNDIGRRRSDVKVTEGIVVDVVMGENVEYFWEEK